jgi:tRNA A37 threonylcarbamoyladenosine synthetase subunit TsaC/SUA5/YrdC/very-short-patch-repair endonuclease
MRVVPFSDAAIAEALEVLRSGGVVAHATETVYGLACDIANIDAVKKLFAIKQRPEHQPVSGLFESVDQAKQYVIWNDRAEELAKQYLPGPLTMILPMKEDSPKVLHPTIFLHPLTPSSEEGRGTPNEPMEYLKKKPTNKTVLFHAREMRKSPTEAENIFWEAVRYDQLGTRIRRQHPIGNMILDFYCHEKRLGIEIDGSVHDSEIEQEHDIDREEEIVNGYGVRIIRFSNDDVVHHLSTVMERLKKELQSFPAPVGGRDRGMGETIGVRISSNLIAQTLVKKYASPITTTSANIHGKPNPYSAEDIQEQFKDASVKPDLVIDSGTLPQNPPSTVMDLTQKMIVERRAGTIPTK